jgi:hypothetical protein
VLHEAIGNALSPTSALLPPARVAGRMEHTQHHDPFMRLAEQDQVRETPQTREAHVVKGKAEPPRIGRNLPELVANGGAKTVSKTERNAIVPVDAPLQIRCDGRIESERLSPLFDRPASKALPQ